MRKCEYCHVKFSTIEGYSAHVQSCFYKDNPIPLEPKGKKVKADDNKSN